MEVKEDKTLAAETLALNESADQCFYFRSALNEVYWIHDSDAITIKLYTDCTSLYDVVHSTQSIDDKRLIIDISSLQEKLLQNEEQKISGIKGKLQLVDCFIKYPCHHSCYKCW